MEFPNVGVDVLTLVLTELFLEFDENTISRLEEVPNTISFQILTREVPKKSKNSHFGVEQFLLLAITRVLTRSAGTNMACGFFVERRTHSTIINVDSP